MMAQCYLVNISSIIKGGLKLSRRFLSTTQPSPPPPSLLDFSPDCDEALKARFATDMRVCCDFISEEEEKNLMGELELKFKRARYQFDHWDDVIFQLLYPHLRLCSAAAAGESL